MKQYVCGQIEREFNIHDNVWVMKDNRACRMIVRGIREKVNIISGWEQAYRSYVLSGLDDKLPEHMVFPTKQALLESL